ncbi:hypothetical protein DRO49_05685 [Candidatus Bathyarchaeota archaeon]|nr:MAG: hypothetical protein DRO49_05685 [Candidatus Bathyarchaeota archaeon]
MALITVVKQFTVSASTTSTETIYTVTAGKKLKLNKVKIWFPSGTNSELRVVILHGVERVVPEEGYLVGDGEEYSLPCQVEYGSQEEVKALLTNTSTTDSRTVQITLEGEED